MTRDRNSPSHWKLDSKVTVGDLLTSFSIIVSAAGLIITWTYNQDIQRRQQADQIRNAATVVLSKMERWQEISLYALDSFHETTIQISHSFQDHGKSRSDIRDIAWDEIEKTALTTETKEFDEQLEEAYVSLYAFSSPLKPLIEQVLSQMREDQDKMFNDLEVDSEDIISSADANAAYTEPAVVRDPMRTDIAGIRLRYEQTLRGDLKVLRSKLAQIVNSSDSELLSANR